MSEEATAGAGAAASAGSAGGGGWAQEAAALRADAAHAESMFQAQVDSLNYQLAEMHNRELRSHLVRGRESGGSHRARGGRRGRRQLGDEGYFRQEGRAFKDRQIRRVQRKGWSLWSRLKRLAFQVVALELILLAILWFFRAYGGPFSAETSAYCPGMVAAAPESGSLLVKLARENGEAIHRLSGPPPDPRKTQAVAKKLGEGTVVAILALKASMVGGKDDPRVKKYDDDAARRQAVDRARNVAACAPCPQDGTQGPSQPMTVALSSGGAGVARRAAAAAGFRGQSLEVAVAVAGAESQYKATAANPSSSARGLWQIMLSAHQDDPEIDQWADPYANARMAYRISDGGRDWSPWTTYTGGQYRKYLRPAPAGASTVPVAACDPPARGASSKVGPSGPWGGFENGRIPASRLCVPKTARGARFECGAAGAFDRMSTAYRARFGRGISVTDSYRDYHAQVLCQIRKGSMCASPGTSNHGWGKAADLGGGVQSFGTAEHRWLVANAPRFGWQLPGWAHQGGSKPEPWHFEYGTEPKGPTA